LIMKFQVKLVLNGNKVNSIIEDRSGDIWIGTDKGISRYNIQSQKFVHYPNNNGVSIIYKDDEGSLWLGTNIGVGIYEQYGRFFYKITCRTLHTLPHQIRILFHV
jgi:ligand-binding sensor domain-containing protein